jgi:hypothetical protein
MDNLLISHGYTFLSKSTVLLKTYLVHRNDDQKRLECWQNMLSVMAARHPSGSDSTPIPLLSQALDMLSEAGKSASDGLKPKSDEMDALVGRLLAETLNGIVGSSSAQVLLIRRIMTNPSMCISYYIPST